MVQTQIDSRRLLQQLNRICSVSELSWWRVLKPWAIALPCTILLLVAAVSAFGQQAAPVCYFYHSDHLGSTSVITDKDGHLVDHYQYTSYGRNKAGGGSGTPAHPTLPLSNRFTSQVYDEGSGLYYYNARYYDPELGNFIQPDTIVPEPNNPQTIDRYSYVQNNPLNRIDPSGHQSMEILDSMHSNPQQVEANFNNAMAFLTSPVAAIRSADAQANGAYRTAIATGSGPEAAFGFGAAVWGTRITGGLAAQEGIYHQEIVINNSGTLEAQPFASRPAEIVHDLGAIVQIASWATAIKAFGATALNPGAFNPSVASFGSTAKLIDHFERHGAEFGAKSTDEYLEVGRDIMRQGIKVKYNYKGEPRTGFVQFMGNTKKGASKFGFVGTNNDGAITTIHVESGNSFWKMLNGSPVQQTIAPFE